MTVYVDLLFWLNAVINYLLLQASAVIGGHSRGVWRLIAGAVLGGLYAVLTVIPGLEFLAGGGCQLLSATGMILLAFGWKKSTVKQGLFFFALSFAFGGVVLLLVQTMEPDCLFLGGRAYYAVTTPALLLLAGICYGLSALVLSGWGTHTGGDIVPMELSLGEKTVALRALRDTGNTLRDPLTGENILVANWRILSALLPGAGLTGQQFHDPGELLIRLDERYPKLRFRVVSYRAVGVESGLMLAVQCAVKQGKRSRNILVAFTPTEVSAQGQFEALTGGAVT